MPITEAQVVEFYCAELRADDRTVTTEVEFVDMVAHRDGQKIYAKASGHTSSTGTDVDAMHDELLPGMGDEPKPRARYAVVVYTPL